jgi:hypothetical protein
LELDLGNQSVYRGKIPTTVRGKLLRTNQFTGLAATVKGGGHRRDRCFLGHFADSGWTDS